jgi:hypothetical protein
MSLNYIEAANGIIYMYTAALPCIPELKFILTGTTTNRTSRIYLKIIIPLCISSHTILKTIKKDEKQFT